MGRTTKQDGDPIRLTYDACPNCKKKTGTTCVGCNKDNVESVPRLLISSMKMEDASADPWCNLFEQGGTTILDMQSRDLFELEKNNDELQSTLKKKYFRERFSLRVRTKMDMWESQLRTKTPILAAEKLNENDHCSA